jgi:hypothetical protein
MARAALHSLLQRGDVDIDSEVDRINTRAVAEAVGKGRSLAQIEAMLQD